MNRRRVLQLFGVGLAAGGLSAIAGCNRQSEEAAPAPAAEKPAAAAGGTVNCSARETLDDQARQMRRTLQYVEKSPKPDKHCSICSQFEAGSDCGKCKLFGGLVNPNGFCLSFAPIGSAPPAVPGAPPANTAPATPGKPG